MCAVIGRSHGQPGRPHLQEELQSLVFYSRLCRYNLMSLFKRAALALAVLPANLAHICAKTLDVSTTVGGLTGGLIQ